MDRKHMLMWINYLLVLFYGSPFYWHTVGALYRQGCQVYNDVYVSCSYVDSPPPGAVPVPIDAVQVFPQYESTPRRK